MKSSIHLPFKNEEIAIHCFENESSPYPPILLIHGSIENGRIFYSKSGKGLAPFLCREGFNVYVADLRGRGESIPAISSKSTASQTDTISDELPAIVEKVLELSGASSLHLGAHSWGGVLLMSAYAMHYKIWNVDSMIFFGTKRKISIRTLRKFLTIDLGWTLLGSLLTGLYGYLPAISFRMGSDNDAARFYHQSNQWVYASEWIDPDTGFDYKGALRSIELPPVYLYAGANDRLLGHPVDVQLFAEESGITNDIIMLSRENGNRHDYDHINMLTHPDSVDDHFPAVAQLFKKHSRLNR